jgi:hypothetical protein
MFTVVHACPPSSGRKVGYQVGYISQFLVNSADDTPDFMLRAQQSAQFENDESNFGPGEQK